MYHATPNLRVVCLLIPRSQNWIVIFLQPQSWTNTFSNLRVDDYLLSSASERNGYLFPNFRVVVLFSYSPTSKLITANPTSELTPTTFVPNLRVDVHHYTRPQSWRLPCLQSQNRCWSQFVSNPRVENVQFYPSRGIEVVYFNPQQSVLLLFLSPTSELSINNLPSIRLLSS